MMLGPVGRLAAVAGVSLGTIWLQQCSHHQDKLASPVQRFTWTVKAAEEEKTLPRVYFIIRFDLHSGTHNMKAFFVTDLHMNKAIIFL